jgi:hypothetical protein
MSSLALMNSLPVRSDDADFFAADARKFYRHADQPIFLLLLVNSEGVLVHDDNRSEEVGCSAASGACHEYG